MIGESNGYGEINTSQHQVLYVLMALGSGLLPQAFLIGLLACFLCLVWLN